LQKEQRSTLRTAVVKGRRLLEKDFQEQLEGAYNILPDGRILEDAPGDPIVRERLLEVLQHHRSGGATAPEAVDRVVREAAFTVLNHFAALKMAERRELVRECVSHGMQSEGIRELAECAPGLRGALEDGGYRLLLGAVMDEISLDLRVLFDRRDSKTPLWPGPKVLDDLLEMLNDPHLADIWAEDETIGWVYQYFNDTDVKEMRDAAKGGAPRNSRELAVRNQFFTPRYVVEFLTGNTLGRLWYEMTRGETALRDRCRYLVRRPTEVFLNPGESASKSVAGSEAKTGESLTQEDLLRQPVHIPHRPLKDPREIRLLDPACGSMHFGLYAFDLFTVMYDEAWDVAQCQDHAAKAVETFAPFVAFTATFPDKAAFLREMPRLIVEHNIHGIDIDSRAVQIAGLSLWLRAQRAWHQAGVKPADRPRITRSNLVCAEPMPGEKELLREFVEQQFLAGERPAFAFLLETIFDRMIFASEAGSLLRIEEEIRTAITDAKRIWKQGPKAEQASLFAESGEMARQGAMRLDLSGITDEQFWERAEQRIYDALEAYAEHAEMGGGFQRRLFADDAAQGFAFIDLCRKRYDVVVMNPPFGESTPLTAKYIKRLFPSACSNLGATFVDCGLARISDQGLLGVIIDNATSVRSSYETFRRSCLYSKAALQSYATLGWDVLDANVEIAIYVLKKGPPSQLAKCFCCDLHHADEKDQMMLEAVCRAAVGELKTNAFLVYSKELSAFPNGVPNFTLPASLRGLFGRLPALQPAFAEVKTGMSSGDNERFYKLSWEVPRSRIGTHWRVLHNGGEYSPFYRPGVEVVAWGSSGEMIRAHRSSTVRNLGYFFRGGLGYSKRGEFFAVQILPEGCAFTDEGQTIFTDDGWSLCAYLSSRVISVLLNEYCGQHKSNGYVALIPATTAVPQLREIAIRACQLKRSSQRRRMEHMESLPFVAIQLSGSIGMQIAQEEASDRAAGQELSLLQNEIESRIGEHLNLCSRDLSYVLDKSRRLPEWGSLIVDEQYARSRTSELIDWFFGVVFGRWDIRYATGERTAPDLSDPWAPLPVFPPGMLQDTDGLPLSQAAGRRLRAEGCYSLDIVWDGILVDDPEHPLDLERRIRAALVVLWPDRSDALEHEACELLAVPTLREWFRRPAGFFAGHLKRYSKSRRKAPIYWPLSTASGSYTIWVYYHSITADTLFQLVAEHLEPKLRKTKEERLQLEAEQAKAEGRESAKLAKQAGELVAIEQELEEMKAELLRVAELPFNPDLNDGVQITAAPLWRLFRHPKWRKDLEATWKKLEKGAYDWAHLAYALWPERVREKCKTDRSLAIAHGLEDVCEVKPKKKRRKKNSE